MALRWLNLPCALKPAIGYGKQTLGDVPFDQDLALRLDAGPVRISITKIPTAEARAGAGLHGSGGRMLNNTKDM